MKYKDSARSGNPVSAILLAATVVLALVGSARAYTEKTLYSFCSVKISCKDGSYPSGLVMDASGDLFGVAGAGGKSGSGVVFEFASGTGQYTVLHSFCSRLGCKDGARPARVNLVVDVNGNLYGTTQGGGNKQGGGVVFELVRTDSGWHQVTLYDFCSRENCTDGAMPRDGLTYAGAAAGQLYDGVSPLFGTTYSGGTGGGTGGTAFSLRPQSGSKHWIEQVLYNFCSEKNCTDGTQVDTPLYVDGQGNIFGTTPFGGQSNEGIVFELRSNGSNYIQAVLYSFCVQNNCADGLEPEGGAIMDAQGNLYGSAAGGGANKDGLIFELSPNGSQWQFADAADFDGTNGASPDSPLIMDASGNLLGTSGGGGTGSTGTVFEFSGSLQALYNFCKKCGGSGSGVIEDGAGNIYGETVLGGQTGKGTLYELTP